MGADHDDNLARAESLDWQTDYNALVLQQRVREELEKKRRYDELQLKEKARLEQQRKATLARELARIRNRFRKAKSAHAGGPTLVYSSFHPFGHTLELLRVSKLDAVLSLGSHGFLGVWKEAALPTQPARALPAPTLVDYADATRETFAGDLEHVIAAACFIIDPVSEEIPSSVASIIDELEEDRQRQREEAKAAADKLAATHSDSTSSSASASRASAVAAQSDIDSTNDEKNRAEKLTHIQSSEKTKGKAKGKRNHDKGREPNGQQQDDEAKDADQKDRQRGRGKVVTTLRGSGGGGGGGGGGGPDADDVKPTRVLTFSMTPTGRGFLTVCYIAAKPHLTADPETLTEDDMQSFREAAALFGKDPAAAIRNMRVNLEDEGVRWIHSVDTLLDRPMARHAFSAVSYAAASSCLVGCAQNTVRGFDVRLRCLWTCQLDTLLQPPRDKTRDTVSLLFDDAKSLSSAAAAPAGRASLSTQARVEERDSAASSDEKISCMVPLDPVGRAFLFGLANGQLVLLETLREAPPQVIRGPSTSRLVPQATSSRRSHAIEASPSTDAGAHLGAAESMSSHPLRSMASMSLKRPTVTNNAVTSLARSWFDAVSARAKKARNRDGAATVFSKSSVNYGSSTDLGPADSMASIGILGSFAGEAAENSDGVGRLVTSPQGAKLMVLAKFDQAITCILPLNEHAIAVGFDDGSLAQVLSDARHDEGTIFIPDTGASSVRALAYVADRERIISCDEAGTLRVFASGRLEGLTRTASILKPRCLYSPSPDRNLCLLGAHQRFSLLAQDSFTAWRLAEIPK
ncbi:Hypothetical Protein FCC1311_097552 [Hondaea fermentalgiana]|uniref:Uncharacterized protein n=1 Tax=Hondaea fermentalgiana TaxID=2315210 RepID=A0A2R5GRM8_9STRA|nr:Hypothetical Protein FCC1311_097552 [Hondaea fermentalgiana]|eukprot:GBG33532.1 Hypothetical Protein FCC1311_097552 [Hondaea fermentalgiana]